MKQLLVVAGLIGTLAQAQPILGNIPNINGKVEVLRVSNYPTLLQMNYDQIRNIGLSCDQKDLIIAALESQVGNQPRMPETLIGDVRRVNAIARSKIWQLRTYCQ